MRIALVSTPFVSVPPRGYGGTELIVGELLEGLLRAGHDVTLFATGDSQAPDLRALFPRASWPPDPRTEALHCRWVAGVLGRERFDVVHAHVPLLLPHARDLGAPFVYTLHHAHDERLSALYRTCPGVRHVAISARQAQLEPGLACDVVHHGLDPARHRAGAGRGGYVAFLGRLAPCKAPELAIAAARLAGARIKVGGDFHEADDEPGWHAEVARALAAPGVEHVGPVHGRRKLAFLAEARALLMPLRWEEPFGLVMIEAMLCGTPVLAFPRGSAPELVEDGVTGRLVRDEREMAAAIADVGRLDRAACRERAQERFSSARMARDYVAVYQRAVAGAEESSYAG